MSDDEWGAFRDALARELHALKIQDFIVLKEEARPVNLVQFVRYDDELRAETVGDVYDDGQRTIGGLLTVRGDRLLRSAGWQPPTEQDVEDGDVNWFISTPVPYLRAEIDEVADACVTALRDVREMASPSALVYRSWNSDGTDRTLDIPGVRPA